MNTLRATNLDRIQELLIRGERQAAYQYAADEKLWAHAMVIASSIGKEAWKNIVSEFVRTELTSAPTIAGLPKPSALDGREPLKVAYSLFAGQGAAAGEFTLDIVERDGLTFFKQSRSCYHQNLWLTVPRPLRKPYSHYKSYHHLHSSLDQALHR